MKFKTKKAQIADLAARNAALDTALEASYDEQAKLRSKLDNASADLEDANAMLDDFQGLARGAAEAITSEAERANEAESDAITFSNAIGKVLGPLGDVRDALGAARSVLGGLTFLGLDRSAESIVEAAISLVEAATEAADEGIACLTAGSEEMESLADDEDDEVTLTFEFAPENASDGQ